MNLTIATFWLLSPSLIVFLGSALKYQPSLKLKIKACLEKNGWKVDVEDVKGLLYQGYLEGKVSPPDIKELIDSYVAANSMHFALFYKLLLPPFYEDLIKNA